MLSLAFAVTLPLLLAADAGGDVTPRAADTAPALIPQPAARPVAQAERVELKDAKDGSGDLLYEGNGFSARIAPDGSVAFSDQRVTGLSQLPWLPMRVRLGVPSLESSVRMLLGGGKPRPQPPSELAAGLPPPETTQLIPQVSRYRPDPREGCRQCEAFNELAVPVQAMGRFDVTDELTRFSGQDPNRYQKATFLAATQEKRIQMAVKLHAANIRRAAAALPVQLQAIACEERLSHKERRAIMVALANEMDTNTREGASAKAAIGEFVERFDAGTVGCVARR